MSSEKAYDLERRLNGLLTASLDPWHTFTGLGFSNSWTNGTQTPSKYRLEPFPFSTVSLVGSLTVPTGFAVDQTIVTLPSGYRPLSGHTQVITGRNMTTGNAVVTFTITSGGLFRWGGGTSVTNISDDIIFGGLIWLDA